MHQARRAVQMKVTQQSHFFVFIFASANPKKKKKQALCKAFKLCVNLCNEESRDKAFYGGEELR